MLRAILLLFCLLSLSVAASVEPACPEGEVWDPCGRPDPICDNPFPVHLKICNPGRCVCNPGLLRSAHGNCIESRGCQEENNPCLLVECAAGRACVIEPVICKKAPCPKKPLCIERKCFA
ncbi:hypothetical protein QR680_006291 [Steinernema hermaphroditum]|uniref:TIL domain-containing protein n=1 Tax=Steinernema hermaphroditum TaxID=289476 RepID=A0AA39HX58_9BILA|nr:hypothetical protein QR680_006291 [Steinernema hermaphroditum]